MKRARTGLLALFVILSAVAPARAAEPVTYGKGVTATEVVPIGALLTSPEKYVGRRVRVEGRIQDVCPARGCWIDVAGEGAPGVVRFKVTDGEITFPVDAKGHPVSAEGVFERLEMKGEQAVAWMRHLAEEKGQPFDPATVKDPLVLYQIRGMGAVVR